MNKLFFILLIAFLAGCTTPPKQQKFPDYPPSLGVECPPLELVPENEEKLSGVLTVVTRNYSKYKECREKVSAWNEWHKKQKKIYEEVAK